jgi:mannose-6-phosphate isomerase-like protein (cupin superfamily)
MIWKTVGQDTDGQVATLLYEGGAGVSGPPPHYHKETAEVGYVLEGSITFHLEDRDVEAGPGSFFYIPPGLVHSWSSHGDKQVKFLGFALPAGIENYFLEIVELMEREPSWPPEDMSKIAALGRKYDQYTAKGPS